MDDAHASYPRKPTNVVRHTRARRALATAACIAACAGPLACGRTNGDERPAPPASAQGEPAVERPSYGAVMADVARRFELLGRAGAAGRFELASYELGELGEVFEAILPHAELPKEGHPEALPPLVKSFAEHVLPEATQALTTRDRARFRSAFARMAEACNSCHRASGHGFIEIPSEPGRPVPNVDPLPEPSAAASASTSTSASAPHPP